MVSRKLKQWGPWTWPTWQKALFFGVLAWFWIYGIQLAHRIGNTTYFHTDSSTEGMSLFAANHYLDHGFFKNYLLPTYPPFGHDPSGRQRTEPFVYAHYLAGPDLTLALFMKVFGRDMMWAARAIPHTLTVVAIGWLCVEFAAFMGASTMGLLLLGLLMLPKSLTAWSICIYGHSYVMAFYLMLVAGILRLLNCTAIPAKQASRNAWILGFSIGLLQMFFDLDWVPVTFLSAVSMVVLLPQLPWKQGRRLLLGMVLGGTTAVAYQIFLSSLHHGSFMWVVNNTIDWIFFRAGTTHVEGQTMGDLRLHRVLKEYNRQTYGATGFTAYNLMTLSAVFLIMGLLGKAISVRTFWRGIASVLLSYVAAAWWNVVMRQHSVAHTHFLPRHYFVLYMNLMLIALPIGYLLVTRSRSLKGT